MNSSFKSSERHCKLDVLAQVQKHTADKKQIRNARVFPKCCKDACVDGGAGISPWVSEALLEAEMQITLITDSDEAVSARYQKFGKGV